MEAQLSRKIEFAFVASGAGAASGVAAAKFDVAAAVEDGTASWVDTRVVEEVLQL